MGKYRDIFITK